LSPITVNICVLRARGEVNTQKPVPSSNWQQVETFLRSWLSTEKVREEETSIFSERFEDHTRPA
jgi:hypothetical protein